MSEPEQRIRCRYCGSNNFAGTTTCWQCNRALLISKTEQNNAALAPPQQASVANAWGTTPSVDRPQFANYSEKSISDKSAIALGLLFPLIGYPVGIVFMMLDDQRKTQIGKLTLLWSTIGLVVSVVLTLLTIMPLVAMGSKLLPGAGGGGASNALTHALNGSGDDQ